MDFSYRYPTCLPITLTLSLLTPARSNDLVSSLTNWSLFHHLGIGNCENAGDKKRCLACGLLCKLMRAELPQSEH